LYHDKKKTTLFLVQILFNSRIILSFCKISVGGRQFPLQLNFLIKVLSKKKKKRIE